MTHTKNIICVLILALIVGSIYWLFGGKEGFRFFGEKEGFYRLFGGKEGFYRLFGEKEGFYQYLGYPPFAGPGYFFNFPTREYPPPSFMGYDLRGPPGCPFFGRCGEAIRSGDVVVPDKRYFYDYWWPLPQFRYDKFYGANGRLHSTD